MSCLALVTALALWAGPPEEPQTEERPPQRWLDGSVAMGIGATLQVLSLGGGITGAVLGGSSNLTYVFVSTIPSAAGGTLVITGASLRGRHRGWYDPRDLLRRAKTARRVGWALMGVGLGLFVGNAAASMAWPHEHECADECAPLLPGAYIAVQSGFLLGQVMISTSASTLAWSYSYSHTRARRLELAPTLGGLSMRF